MKNLSYREDFAFHYDTYHALQDGIAAVESAYLRFPNQVPLANLLQMKRDAEAYRKKRNL